MDYTAQVLVGFVLFFFSHPVQAGIFHSEVYYKCVCNLRSCGSEAEAEELLELCYY